MANDGPIARNHGSVGTPLDSAWDVPQPVCLIVFAPRGVIILGLTPKPKTLSGKVYPFQCLIS